MALPLGFQILTGRKNHLCFIAELFAFLFARLFLQFKHSFLFLHRLMDYVQRFQLQKQFYLDSTFHERVFKKKMKPR